AAATIGAIVITKNSNSPERQVASGARTPESAAPPPAPVAPATPPSSTTEPSTPPTGAPTPAAGMSPAKVPEQDQPATYDSAEKGGKADDGVLRNQPSATTEDQEHAPGAGGGPPPDTAPTTGAAEAPKPAQEPRQQPA